MSPLRVELEPRDLRLVQPLRTAHGLIEVRLTIIVRVFDGVGRVGCGEAAPLAGFETEQPERCLAALRAACCKPLDEVMLSSPDAIDAALDKFPELLDAPSARCGLELALLDLGARRLGVPLFRWLRPGASSSVEVSALLADEALDAPGFGTVKVKVGRPLLVEDIARVAAVRAAVGDRVKIRLDANGAWSPEHAASALRALSSFAPSLCEQPIAPGQPQAFGALRGCGVPLAADESMATQREAEVLIDGALVDSVVLKPQALGGHVRALRIALRAADKNITSIVTTSLEGVVGRAGAAALAAATGSLEAHGLATGDLLATDLGPDPLAPRRGRIALNETPGTGIDVLACPVARWARETPEAPALHVEGASVNYAALDRHIERVEGRLLDSGLRHGDRLALLADASLEAIVLLHASARLGVAVALLNTRLTQAELRPMLDAVEPRLVAAAHPYRALVAEALPLEQLGAHGGRVEDPEASDASPETPGASGGAPWRLAANDRPAARRSPPHIELDGDQIVLFTSGTTGRPKGVRLTASALLASARAAERLLGLDGSTRWLLCLPLFHIGGLSILHRCALVGGCAVVQPRFDARSAAAAILADGITHASLVATTLLRTLDAIGARRPTSLRAVMVGGGPVPLALLDRAARAGFPVLQTYGLTEAASHVTCEDPATADGSTVGRPVPGTEIRVVDGEVQVRGPTLLVGRLGDESITEPVATDGWLRTGDLGALDDRGRLVIHARRTDLIISGGENVYPAEVEAALLLHPAVAEVAVIGLPDAQWGQRVAAAIVRRGPCDSEELERFLRERLARFKLPRSIRFVEALPRNAAGKVDRLALASLLKG